MVPRVEAATVGTIVSAEAAHPAQRVSPPTACQPHQPVPSAARVVVDVIANGSSATLQVMHRASANGWTCRAPLAARIGRNGVRPLAERVGGDGTTPSGVFPLGTMTTAEGEPFQFFGNGANPGVPGAWHQVRPSDCWWTDPGTEAYNTLVARAPSECTGDNEYLPSYRTTYSMAALIGANMGSDRVGARPGETPRAAAIFLHAHTYDSAGRTKPTSGCVSLAVDDLAGVLRQLTPGQTWFVIG